jgi:hypothetical protein
VSKEVTEQQGKKTTFWLRVGEVWVRKTGDRELATAEDLDAMYEGKLRSLVNERLQPLQERVERIERDLREQKSVIPEITFGLALPGDTEPLPEGSPRPVLGNLVDPEGVDEEIEWAKAQAFTRRSEAGPFLARTTVGPTAKDFEEYERELETWLRELEDLLIVEFMITNTDRAPAEDVEVIVSVPFEPRPREELPEMPDLPRSVPASRSKSSHLRASNSPCLSPACMASVEGFEALTSGARGFEKPISLFGGEGLYLFAIHARDLQGARDVRDQAVGNRCRGPCEGRRASWTVADASPASRFSR